MSSRLFHLQRATSLHRLRSDEAGSVVVLTALSLFALVGFCGLAVDVSVWLSQKNAVQGAADFAALSAEVAASKGATPLEIQNEVYSAAIANGFTNGQNGVTVTLNNPPQSGNYTGNTSAYEVIITRPQTLYFSGVVLHNAPNATGRAVAITGSGGPTTCVTQSGAGTTYTLVGGATQTVSGDINGQTITVTGNGTLALGHDADGAHITVNSPCVTITIAHDFNGNGPGNANPSGVFTDQATPPGKNYVSIGDYPNGANGETFSGGSVGSGGVFNIGHDANGAYFTFQPCGSLCNGQPPGLVE